jgi:hypothetical protein
MSAAVATAQPSFEPATGGSPQSTAPDRISAIVCLTNGRDDFGVPSA